MGIIQRLEEDFLIIFVATFVSVTSSAVYFQGLDLFSEGGFFELLKISGAVLVPIFIIHLLITLFKQIKDCGISC